MLKKFWLVTFILAAACAPTATPVPTRAPTATPADEFALYRQSLTSAAQNDLALVDRPTRYNLTLTYTANPPTLTGSQDVLYFNRQTQPLNEIYFRLFANYPDNGGKITVSQVLIDGASTTPTQQVQNTALRVPLTQPLAPNTAILIHLDFNIAIPRENKSHYADFVASDSIVTLPTVYPLIPAYDAKGWHIELPPPYGDLVYADASLYAAFITVPSDMIVIASGSTIDKRTNADGTVTWLVAGGPMRDFDINLTNQLQKTSMLVGETIINSYYEPADAESGKKALQIAVDAFKTFEKRFGAYPYRELDVIETPTLAGGIEYPGAIAIGRRLYTEKNQQDFFEFATAHEVAHQWWYGMVGNDQINYPWLDEATTQYSTLIYYETIRGTAAGASILRNVFQQPYNRLKNDGRDMAVNQPVSAFNEAEYATIVYDKGALFFDALRKKMSDDKFFLFFKTYLERYKYKIAFPNDMLTTAEETCGCSLQTEYQQWITSPAK